MYGYCTHTYTARHLKKISNTHTHTHTHLVELIYITLKTLYQFPLYLVRHFEIGERDSGSRGEPTSRSKTRNVSLLAKVRICVFYLLVSFLFPTVSCPPPFPLHPPTPTILPSRLIPLHDIYIYIYLTLFYHDCYILILIIISLKYI